MLAWRIHDRVFLFIDNLVYSVTAGGSATSKSDFVSLAPAALEEKISKLLFSFSLAGVAQLVRA